MPLSNLNIKALLVYGLTGVWFIFVIIGFWVMLTSRLVWYDPEQHLLNRYSSTAHYLEAWQHALPMDLKVASSMLKIQQAGCRCNSIYQSHWRQLASENPHAKFVELEYQALSAPLRDLVINLPIVVYINEAAEVTYVGPLSAGATCDSSNSLIEAYLTGQATLPYVPLSLKGCYCL